MEELLPTEFYLSRNHPDPFKEHTTIKYCVPQTEKIKIKVMDYERKKIKILVNEIKDGGTYQVEFYANGLKEGIYFYRMVAGNFVETKKMLLMK